MKTTIDLSSNSNESPDANGYPAMLIAMCFELRTKTHMTHLRVTGPGSYAQHVALGDYYSSIGSLVDEYAECYQGRYGVINAYPDFRLEQDVNGALNIGILRDWIDANRQNCGSESELQNLIDNIQALNNKTLYKLNNLA